MRNCVLHRRPLLFCSSNAEAPKDEYTCMITQIKAWLDNCTGGHTKCAETRFSRADASIVPTRLIDVGLDTQQPRLRELGPQAIIEKSPLARYAGYATLSYCWGPRPSREHLLFAENRDAFCKALPALPKTIQDAVHICRRIGVQYLWVDALCILQDPDAALSDWNAEATRVGMYYNNALFTIAAAWSSHNDEGCIPSRKTQKAAPRYSAPLRAKLSDWKRKWVDSGEMTVTEVFDFFYMLLGTCPLLLRGWVLQEITLSSRILWFTQDKVFWQCREELKNTKDRATSSYPGQLLLLDSDLNSNWLNIVEQFSKMDFTNQEDRLPAISGICRMLDPEQKDEYLAGIWKGCFAEQMAWYIDWDSLWKEDDPLIDQDGLPSWSWISKLARLKFGSVNLNQNGLQRTAVCDPEACPGGSLRLSEANIQLQYDDPYGRIHSSAYIEVIVRTSKLDYLAQLTHPQGTCRALVNGLMTCNMHFDKRKFIRRNDRMQMQTVLLDHRCGPSGNALFLLIEPLATPEGFRRIGLAIAERWGDNDEKVHSLLKKEFGEAAQQVIKLY